MTSKGQPPPITGQDESDIEIITNDLNRSQSAKNRFAPKEPAEYTVRILPPRIKGRYYRTFGMHFDVNSVLSGFGERSACGCYRLSYEKDCPICEVRNHLRFLQRQLRGEPERMELFRSYASSLQGRVRHVMNVILVNQPDRGVLTWELYTKAHDMIRPFFIDYGDITNPQTGHDLLVTYAKQGPWPVVGQVRIRRDSTPIKGVENWREARHDLEAFVASRMMSVDEMKEALQKSDPLEGVGPDDVVTSGRTAEPRRAAEYDDTEVVDAVPDEKSPWDEGTPGIVDGAAAPQAASAPNPFHEVFHKAEPEERGDPIAALATAAGVDMADENVKKLLDAMKKSLKQQK